MKQAPPLTSTLQQKQPEVNLWEKDLSLPLSFKQAGKKVRFERAGKALTGNISRNDNTGKSNTGDKDS